MPPPGFAGVGIRGTTGRLDDFGVRSLEPEPRQAPPRRSRRLAGAGSVELCPGRRRPSTAARRSPTTGCTAVRAPEGRPSSRTPAHSTSFADIGRCERNDLLLQGVRGERQRREPALERGVRDADGRSCLPAMPLPTVDDFDRPNENPLSDAGRWTNGVNGSGETRSLHRLEHARLLEFDDLHRVAQQRPVRTRHRGLGADLHTPGGDNQVRLLRAHPSTGHVGLRRLHAAHNQLDGHRPAPHRADRQRRARPLCSR